MNKINVKHIERSTYSNRGEGLNVTCDHEFVEVTPPCCTGRVSDCGCFGEYQISCPDCDESKIPQFELDDLVNRYLGGLKGYARTQQAI